MPNHRMDQVNLDRNWITSITETTALDCVFW